MEGFTRSLPIGDRLSNVGVFYTLQSGLDVFSVGSMISPAMSILFGAVAWHAALLFATWRSQLYISHSAHGTRAAAHTSDRDFTFYRIFVPFSNYLLMRQRQACPLVIDSACVPRPAFTASFAGTPPAAAWDFATG